MAYTEDIEYIRHSLSHLLAAAVLELYPHAKPTIGPATDTGFYYDFDLSDGDGISHDDLPTIEKKMREILKTWDTFEQQEVDHDEAMKRFQNNPYKQELIEELADHKERITLYTSGTFTDLCRGGHVENAQNIDPDAFTLTDVAGAYWRGDETNQMLTRIYGLAFHTKQELQEHQQMLEEAKQRDHRTLGKELDLFTFSDMVGQGLPLFTPKGALIRDLLSERLKALNREHGYELVTIPHLTKRTLYETSGHIEKFGDDLFKVYGAHDEEFVLKPMNCPHHTQVYAANPKSYRDLPVRYMETTTVYRDEQAGELHGLSRTRSITQDDGHVFCTPDQIENEIRAIIDVIATFYRSLDMFGDNDFRVTLSTHDPDKPDEYLGDIERWDTLVSTMEEIARNTELPYEKEAGEAAFYGPKFDFHFKDAIGREWQLATIQLDFLMPERFGLEYKDADGDIKTPVMIHRAITGSLERFLSVLIEHFAGAFPVWLSPVQARVLPVNSDDHGEYAHDIVSKLAEQDIRAELDASNESLGKRIRAAKTQKVPYILVVGDNEKEQETVNVDSRDEGDLGAYTVADISHRIHE